MPASVTGSIGLFYMACRQLLKELPLSANLFLGGNNNSSNTNSNNNININNSNNCSMVL